MKLYTIVDKIKHSSIAVFMAENDGIAIRENAPTFSRVLPLGDLSLVCIGDFDVESQKITPCVPAVVDWNNYKFPESPLPITANATIKKEKITK